MTRMSSVLAYSYEFNKKAAVEEAARGQSTRKETLSGEYLPLAEGKCGKCPDAVQVREAAHSLSWKPTLSALLICLT